MYDDAGMIDEDKVIKIVAECNEKLGMKIYKPRECMLTVDNYEAESPRDLHKIENLLGTEIYQIANLNPDFGTRLLEYTSEKPKDDTHIITYGKMGCVDSCNNCYWVKDKRPHTTDQVLTFERFIPLQLSPAIHNSCTDYSPCSSQKREYKVDLEEEKFKFNFQKGSVYLSYIGKLLSNDGEIQLPFHPKLNPYYEYAIKEKILEDILLNSEADVVNKLRYINEKKREAYAIAWDFANTREVNEWSKIQKKRQQNYYKQWYSAFN
jgi:hypothetical protein